MKWRLSRLHKAVCFLWHFPFPLRNKGFLNLLGSTGQSSLSHQGYLIIFPYSTGGSPRYGPSCPVELGLSSPPPSPTPREIRRSDHLFPLESPPSLRFLKKSLQSFLGIPACACLPVGRAGRYEIKRADRLFLALLLFPLRSSSGLPGSPNGPPLCSSPSGWIQSQKMEMFLNLP